MAKWINSFICRYKQHVGADLLEATGVTLERAWIVIEVFFVPELRRIDVNGDNNTFRVPACLLDETDVAGVQVTQRWHQCNVLVVMTPFLDVLLHFFFTARYLH